MDFHEDEYNLHHHYDYHPHRLKMGDDYYSNNDFGNAYDDDNDDG